MTTITLTGDYGSKPYKASGLAAGTLIDAENASWTQDNDGSDGSPYPFMVYDSPGAILDGGTINGKVDMTGDWRDVYNDGNSAGIRTEGTPGVVIRDWHITNTWDAVRVSWDSPNFLIEDVWVTNARDDAVENDRLQTGTIRDSLFDGVFGGISVDPSSSSPVDGHNNTVTLDGVLMRMQSFLYEGEMTHSSMIKTDSATDGELTPNLRFINTVFAIEDVEHHSYRSMQDAWNNTVESRGNVFLNLSDTPLPDDYPMPPEGWTVLQGQAARDYWQEAKTEWIERHSGEEGITPDSPATEQPTTTDTGTATGTGTDTVTVTDTGTGTDTGTSPTVYTGTEGDDTLPLTGKTNAGNETYNGLGGSDLLKGGAGADTLDGGAGIDAASYSGSSAAVKVSLGAGTASGGHATGDKFTGIEKLLGSSYGDTLQGDSGNNVLNGGAGADKLDGGAGSDTASYLGAQAGVTASLGNAANNTGDAKGDAYVSIENLCGSSFADKLDGNAGANTLSGGAGNDVLKGAGGNDALYGGLGADDLVGGSGADRFVFKAAADSTSALTGRDTIFDFSGTGGDKIDLADIDANSAASGDQAFTYLGTAAFTGKAGELRYVKQASDTYVYGDTNGDRNADFAIHLDDAVTMSKDYFVL